MGHAVDAPEQLGDDALDRAAAHDRERMTAIRRDELVVGLHRRLHPDRDRLLPDREVAEAADHLLLVQLIRRHLHSPHLPARVSAVATEWTHVICVYISTSWFFETCTSSEGGSIRWPLKVPSCS